MKIVVLDGYVDEPSCLGVPPYISPYPRAAAGAALSVGAEVEYLTIDQVRAGAPLPGADLLVVIGGVAVPGKYLRGYPASRRELLELAGQVDCPRVLGGPLATAPGDDHISSAFDLIATGDLEASVHDFVTSGCLVNRKRTLEEYDDWTVRGAIVCIMHPDFGGPLIAEIQTYRGCVRQHTGGCSFCTEPSQGEVQFRNPDAVIAESEALARIGVRNLRLGGQSCFISYMAEGVGQSETPRPSPGMVDYLLRGIRESADPEVLHLDNANPAVIAAHPAESIRIMESIVKYCTSGNILALGLESADPEVARLNNLNSTPEQTLNAIQMINAAGRERGPTGLPMLLPGLNFLFGLRGESRRTYDLDEEFLCEVRRRELLLRRINIRQVIPSRSGFRGDRIDRRRFNRFKTWVREAIDHPMLEDLIPAGTILRRVYMELRAGNTTFGRQVGTYPILVGVPYKCELNSFADVIVTSHGRRSVTGVIYPLDINSAPMAALSTLPGIGERRARRIVRARPLSCEEDLGKAIDDDDQAGAMMKYITFGQRELVS